MSGRGEAALIYAIRGRVCLKYLGQFGLSVSGIPGVPLVFALATGELDMAWRLGGAFAALVGGGALLGRIAAPARIQTNEALVVTAATFAAASLLMAWVFARDLPFIDALFESVSAITTTGLSTLASVEDRPRAFLFARAWMQWYGGLVVVVLALALILAPGTISKRFAASTGETDDPIGNSHLWARRALAVYVGLTLAGCVVLIALGVDAFDAVAHVLTAVSTAGFSTHDASLAGLEGRPAQVAVIMLCLAGAVSFALYYEVGRSGLRAAVHDVELKSLLVLSAIVILLMAWSLTWVAGWDWPDALYHGGLLAVSAQTTAGFATVTVADLDPASKFILATAMAVGGDSGSTAGGIKIIRFLVVLAVLRFALRRVSLPRNAVATPTVGRRRLEHGETQAALTLVLLFGVVVLASWLAFLAFGHNALDALFEVVSAAATTGLSAGIAAPSLHPLLKFVLLVDMFMGRLEIVAVLILFYPRTWLGRRVAAK